MILLYLCFCSLFPCIIFLKCHHKHNHNNSSGCRRLFGMFASGVSIATQNKLLNSQIFLRTENCMRIVLMVWKHEDGIFV